MDKEYKIISCVESGGYQGKYGPMKNYTLTLDDNGQQIIATLSQKPTTPVPSGTITGSIESTQYGNKFKKAASYGGGGFKKNDPETQRQIIRQTSLQHAVTFCLAKYKSEELDEKTVVKIANYFYQFSSGDMEAVKQAINNLPQPKGGVSEQDIDF